MHNRLMRTAFADGCQVHVNVGSDKHVQDWDGTCLSWVPDDVGIESTEIGAHDGGGGARRAEAVGLLLGKRFWGFSVK